MTDCYYAKTVTINTKSNLQAIHHDLHIKVRVLRKHEQSLPEHFAEANEKASIPLSELDVDDTHGWIETQKPYVHEVETDIRDAKRRVTLAKGPKKRNQEPAGSVSSNDNDDESAEG